MPFKPEIANHQKVPMIMQLTPRELMTAVRYYMMHGETRSLTDCPPIEAEVSVKVPGGGDWSGMDLDLNTAITLDIRWEAQR